MPMHRNIRIVTAIDNALPVSFSRFFKFRDSNSFLKKNGQKLVGVIDRYGVSYLIASRWTGATVVVLIYTAISFQFETSQVLNFFGVSGRIGDVLGIWAVAVTTSSVCYPFTLAIGVISSTKISKLLTNQIPWWPFGKFNLYRYIVFQDWPILSYWIKDNIVDRYFHLTVNLRFEKVHF